MTNKIDYKKEYKDLYLPKNKPHIIDVPSILYIAVDGKGDPNTSEEYKASIELLYGLSYSIKMSKMGSNKPKGYFEYVVPPLEGLWEVADTTFNHDTITDKSLLCWTSMIRQPEFVTIEVFEEAKLTLLRKKPHLDVSKAKLWKYDEGLCVQVMHIGSYDDEPATVALIEKFIVDNGYQNDISDQRRHHEIYLNDPRKANLDKLKTVIRHPIK